MNKMAEEIEVLANEEEHLEGSISFKGNDYSFIYDQGVLHIGDIGPFFLKKVVKVVLGNFQVILKLN